jgi:hypothetical protein
MGIQPLFWLAKTTNAFVRPKPFQQKIDFLFLPTVPIDLPLDSVAEAIVEESNH